MAKRRSTIDRPSRRKQSMGNYKGYQYILQRICDVLVVDYKERWYFLYDSNHVTEGVHFKTVRAFKAYVDKYLPEGGHFEI